MSKCLLSFGFFSVKNTVPILTGWTLNKLQNKMCFWLFISNIVWSMTNKCLTTETTIITTIIHLLTFSNHFILVRLQWIWGLSQEHWALCRRILHRFDNSPLQKAIYLSRIYLLACFFGGMRKPEETHMDTRRIFTEILYRH